MKTRYLENCKLEDFPCRWKNVISLSAKVGCFVTCALKKCFNFNPNSVVQQRICPNNADKIVPDQNWFKVPAGGGTTAEPFIMMSMELPSIFPVNTVVRLRQTMLICLAPQPAADSYELVDVLTFSLTVIELMTLFEIVH